MARSRIAARACPLICLIGLLPVLFSAAVAGQESEFPFALGRLGDTQTGPYVQSGPAVVKLVLRLAGEEEYTSEQATALAEALTVLLGGDVPPGTLLQVSKDLLAAMSPADLLSTLDELGQRILDGEPPGQVANDLLERGSGKDGHPGSGHGKPDVSGKGNDEKDEDVDDEDADLDDEDKDDDPGNGHGKPDTPGKGNDENDKDVDNEDADLDDDDPGNGHGKRDDPGTGTGDDDENLDDEDVDLDDDDEDLDDDDEDLDGEDDDGDDEDDPGSGHGKPDDPGNGKGKGNEKK